VVNMRNNTQVTRALSGDRFKNISIDVSQDSLATQAALQSSRAPCGRCVGQGNKLSGASPKHVKRRVRLELHGCCSFGFVKARCQSQKRQQM
jgi:hypothetical protein